MKNLEGIYTLVGAMITDEENKNKLAIDSGKIINAIVNDPQKWWGGDLEWYVKTTLRAVVDSSLAARGYKSVVRGEGLFVNPEKVSNEAYIRRLANNVKKDGFKADEKFQYLLDVLNRCRNGVPGQLSLDLETGLIIEDITEEEILDMLRADASDEG